MLSFIHFQKIRKQTPFINLSNVSSVFLFLCSGILLFFSFLFSIFFYWWMNTKAFFNNIYFPYSFLWTFIWTKKNIYIKKTFLLGVMSCVCHFAFSVPVWHMENKRNLTLSLVYFFLFFFLLLLLVLKTDFSQFEHIFVFFLFCQLQPFILLFVSDDKKVRTFIILL